MARDLALLERAVAGEGPFLRTYAWAKPTLSLGYGQREEEVVEPGKAAALGVEVVRRFTGGGAILHQHELTFSLALPAGHPWARLAPEESYRACTRPLLGLLEARGVAASFRGACGGGAKAANCFASPACADLVVAGRKLLGSAQRRRQGAFLQHASLLFRAEAALWAALFGKGLGAGWIGLEEAAPGLGGSLDWPRELEKVYKAALGGGVKAGRRVCSGGAGGQGRRRGAKVTRPGEGEDPWKRRASRVSTLT